MHITVPINHYRYRATQRVDRETGECHMPCIVLADDNHELRSLLAAALRRDDYDVVEARDGSELLTRLATQHLRTEVDHPIDLVIADIRMPGCTGLEVLDGLRLSDWATPFILMTSFGDPETHAEGHRLGAAAVFDKPFDLDDLRTIVRNLIH